MMYYSVRATLFDLPTHHDSKYFFSYFLAQQTNPSELNHTNDGFLNSILNDDDLQMVDMAINEGESMLLSGEISPFGVMEAIANCYQEMSEFLSAAGRVKR